MKITKSHLQRIIKEEVNKITEGEGWETYRMSHREETGSGGHGDPSDPRTSRRGRGSWAGPKDTSVSEYDPGAIAPQLDAIKTVMGYSDLTPEDESYFNEIASQLEAGTRLNPEQNKQMSRRIWELEQRFSIRFSGP